MNPSQRNNNPINLKFAGQTEATGKDGQGFAIFPNPPAGWRAAHAQINLDKSRNLTVKEFLFKFAPPSENDTNNYLGFICNSLAVDPKCKLSGISTFCIAGVLAAQEGYYNKW